jgi:predicted nucleotidyltransferase
MEALPVTAIVALLQSRLPGLLAVYAFGSRIQGTANQHSDLDLAVLVAGKVEPLQLWQLADAVAALVSCSVDLLDMRTATAVLQYQVLTTGQRWWRRDVQADLFESFVLSDKTELDAARARLVSDISQTGRIYGR